MSQWAVKLKEEKGKEIQWTLGWMWEIGIKLINSRPKLNVIELINSRSSAIENDTVNPRVMDIGLKYGNE